MDAQPGGILYLQSFFGGKINADISQDKGLGDLLHYGLADDSSSGC